MLVNPWVPCTTLAVDLDRPIEQRYACWGEPVLNKGRELLDSVLAPVPQAVRFLADFVRIRTGNRFQAESDAIAQAIGVPWRDIIIANVAYDLAMTVIGCSTTCLATKDGPILARNMDWRHSQSVARATYNVQTMRNGEVLTQSASFPGCVGVITGMSSRGFACSLNAIKGFPGLGKSGYPVLLHLRRVLDDAENYEHAVEMLSYQRLAAPCIFAVVGTENDQRLIIERTKRDFAHRRAEPDKPLFTTNHFNVLPKPVCDNPGSLFKTSFRRWEGLCTRLPERGAWESLDDEWLLNVLTDERIIQDITAQHIIMRPRENHMGLWVPKQLLEDVQPAEERQAEPVI